MLCFLRIWGVCESCITFGLGRKKVFLAISIVTVLASTGTSAAESAVLFGPGGRPGGCGQWASGHDNAIYSAWLMGYLSAVNSWARPDASVDVSGGTPGDSMLMWMKDWCRKNPLDQAASAAVALIREIAKNHSTAAR
jgi:hypothetical protein